MNNVSLVGRLTKDPDIRYSADNKAVCRFTIAVDRWGDGADFIGCVAFDRTADFVSKYFRKGMKIGITGHIHTDKYEKDGKTVYTTDVIADRAEFVEKKADTADAPAQNPTDDFMKIPDNIGEEIPFN